MRFVDQVRISVKAGDGGNGAVAFRREKYVERGGPSGGDGGNGGSVIFDADPQLTTLLDYRYQQHHHAKDGEHGRGSDCNGASAEDLHLQVPVGTLIKDAATDELLCDLAEAGQSFTAARAGRGGLGNMNFATSTRQTPRFAREGTRGEERTLLLELKLLADVGLLGYPNAGKSTLISRVSRARPKVADYPFTTLVPNLGMVQYKDELSFVMADIPGLIEGASEGAGLGHQFLRHVERCRVLIHLVDTGCEDEGREPLKDWQTLNRELERYSPELAKKPQLVVANKLDLPVARERLPAFTAELRRRGHKVLPLSSATGEGVGPLLDAAAQVLFGGPAAATASEEEPRPRRRPRSTRAEPVKKKAKAAASASAKKKAAPRKGAGKGKPARRGKARGR
jgi:GTP-binding protein